MGTGEVVTGALVKALDMQAPLARRNYERLRRVSPDATPEEPAAQLTKFYLNAVTVSGGVAGGVGVVPGAGMASAGLDAVSFLRALSCTCSRWQRSMVCIPRTPSAVVSWCGRS